MAKKKTAATRQRKKASSPSDELDGVVASTMTTATDADVELPAEAEPPKSPTVTSHDLDQDPVSGSNPEISAKSHPEPSHPDDLAEDAEVAVEDGVQLPEDLELPPPLTVVAPPLPTMRSQPMESAASAASSSSCTSMGGLPRARSFVMSDNATVFQAMPTNKTEVVEVVAEQSWLITKLTVQLLWALRNSHKWVLMAWRLVGFIVCLLPALIRMAHYWAFDPHVHKNLIYGLNGRNLLDVYTVPSDKIAKPSHQQLHPRYQQQQQHQQQQQRNSTVQPSDHQQALGADSVVELKRPVVVFLSGGAWIIGYKGWGALMGKALSAFGIVVVMPDYRNFPQGIIPDMVDDASMAMQWVFDHIHHFGGDPDNVTLVGQSAGAHIATCALLEMVEKRKQWIDGMQGGGHGSTSMGVSASSPSAMSNCSVFSNASIEMGAMLPHTPTWELRQIRNFIGISGPYNMENSIETFHRHGFDRSVVDRIMDHRISYFSPALRLFGYSEHGHAVDLLHDFPPTYLFHGTGDSTVSWKSSEQLAQAMQSCGLRVESQFFKDKTHTDIIIEDPISGSGDVLLAQIVEVIKQRSPRDANGHTVFQFADKFTSPRQYYPQLLVKLARFVNPF